MAALPPSDRVRLVKLLGMLGSEFEAERAAAAALASRFLRDRKLDWGDVFGEAHAAPDKGQLKELVTAAYQQGYSDGHEEAMDQAREEEAAREALAARQAHAVRQARVAKPAWMKMRAICLKQPELWTEWETDFLQGLDRFPGLSDKQRDVLQRLYGRTAVAQGARV